MSKLTLTGNASGTGTLTIAAPNTDSNFTLSIPEATGTIITTAGGAAISGTTGSFSGDLSFNSGFGSAGTAYGCRAWVNFNGTGTVAIRASGNVSSITDNGVGDYTVNFTTAMPDANYAYSAGSQSITGTAGFYITGSAETARTASAIRILNYSENAVGTRDGIQINLAIFR